ncbi:MAG TPA: DUF3892 domain-containing protein [Methylocella sp.]|nr:DUF3892 domain-containing protein [Methylocella sp.]
MSEPVQIKCISRTEKMSPHERMTHVGGEDSGPWTMTVAEAVRKIESGETSFFVLAHRKTLAVIVATGPSGKKYLKTEADGEQPDGLLRLPECV